MSARLERLRASFESRAGWFLEALEDRAATTSGRQSGVGVALRQIGDSVRALSDRVGVLIDSGRYEPDDLETQLMSYLGSLRERIEDYDAHFSRQSRGISPAVEFLLRQQADEWKVHPDSIIVTVGEPNNFSFGEPSFEDLPSKTTLAISVPSIEGSRAAWLPITLGHEWAHYLMRQKVPITGYGDLQERVENAISEALADYPSPQSDSTAGVLPADRLRWFQTTYGWLQELLCDAYAVAAFGPAGYASVVDFLAALSNLDAHPYLSHPPTVFRAKMMKNWLSSVDRALTASEREMVERFDDVAAAELMESSDETSWIPIVLEILAKESATLWDVVQTWLAKRSYWRAADPDRVEALAAMIRRGVPPTVADPRGVHPIVPAEIINSCWQASVAPASGVPVDTLTMKALEDYHFMEKWRKGGGQFAESLSTGRSPDEAAPGACLSGAVPDRSGNGAGVLSGLEISSRLDRADSSALALTPLLGNSIGKSSVDVRLGSQFIVFDRSSNSAFDVLAGERQDPRTMQHRVAKAWGESFFLHPGQLVLAAALEYLVVPEDLSAQVITRSSYGRLGLISATAVQIHPGYHGCLTLELVNLGEIPIAITPGERIAQLMFFNVTGEVPIEPGKYSYPVGPEFSKVKQDAESTVLRSMRSEHTVTDTPAGE